MTRAYAASLRLAFIFAVITAAIALLLVLKLELPTLVNRSEDDGKDLDEGDAD